MNAAFPLISLYFITCQLSHKIVFSFFLPLFQFVQSCSPIVLQSLAQACPSLPTWVILVILETVITLAQVSLIGIEAKVQSL